jgi:hypothetical protein
VRETEATLRNLQLRRGDAKIEKDSRQRVPGEPRRGHGGQVFEACVLDDESRVAGEPLRP